LENDDGDDIRMNIEFNNVQEADDVFVTKGIVVITGRKQEDVVLFRKFLLDTIRKMPEAIDKSDL